MVEENKSIWQYIIAGVVAVLGFLLFRSKQQISKVTGALAEVQSKAIIKEQDKAYEKAKAATGVTRADYERQLAEYKRLRGE